MQNLLPEDYGVPKKLDSQSKEMQYAWKMAIKQLAKIAEMQTPKTKLLQIGKAIEIIQNSFELYHGETVNADDVVSALPYLLVKANIGRMWAHMNYIEAFNYSDDAGSLVEVYLTNLKIAKQRISGFLINYTVKIQPVEEASVKVDVNERKREPQSFIGTIEESKVAPLIPT